MITQLKSTVPVSVKQLPLANYIARAWPLLGRTRIMAALGAKQVRINGVKAGSDAEVKAGDELTLYIDGRVMNDVAVLHEDSDFVAINKPAGLPVNVDEDGIGEDTVLNRLRARYGEVYLAHRLDTGTGGIMLAALNTETLERLTQMFREHCFRKTYRADVLGAMPAKEAVLDAFLIKDAAASKVRVVSKNVAGARDIRTVYRVINTEKCGNYTISRLYVNIPTGRTHQIRAHMAYAGHPLLGDDKYGNRAANKAMHVNEIRLRCVELLVENPAPFERIAGMKFSTGEDEKWLYRI